MGDTSSKSHGNFYPLLQGGLTGRWLRLDEEFEQICADAGQPVECSSAAFGLGLTGAIGAQWLFVKDVFGLQGQVSGRWLPSLDSTTDFSGTVNDYSHRALSPKGGLALQVNRFALSYLLGWDFITFGDDAQSQTQTDGFNNLEPTPFEKANGLSQEIQLGVGLGEKKNLFLLGSFTFGDPTIDDGLTSGMRGGSLELRWRPHLPKPPETLLPPAPEPVTEPAPEPAVEAPALATEAPAIRGFNLGTPYIENNLVKIPFTVTKSPDKTVTIDDFVVTSTYPDFDPKKVKIEPPVEYSPEYTIVLRAWPADSPPTAGSELFIWVRLQNQSDSEKIKVTLRIPPAPASEPTLESAPPPTIDLTSELATLNAELRGKYEQANRLLQQYNESHPDAPLTNPLEYGKPVTHLLPDNKLRTTGAVDHHFVVDQNRTPFTMAETDSAGLVSPQLRIDFLIKYLQSGVGETEGTDDTGEGAAAPEAEVLTAPKPAPDPGPEDSALPDDTGFEPESPSEEIPLSSPATTSVNNVVHRYQIASDDYVYSLPSLGDPSTGAKKTELRMPVNMSQPGIITFEIDLTGFPAMGKSSTETILVDGKLQPKPVTNISISHEYFSTKRPEIKIAAKTSEPNYGPEIIASDDGANAYYTHMTGITLPMSFNRFPQAEGEYLDIFLKDAAGHKLWTYHLTFEDMSGLQPADYTVDPPVATKSQSDSTSLGQGDDWTDVAGPDGIKMQQAIYLVDTNQMNSPAPIIDLPKPPISDQPYQLSMLRYPKNLEPFMSRFNVYFDVIPTRNSWQIKLESAQEWIDQLTGTTKPSTPKIPAETLAGKGIIFELSDGTDANTFYYEIFFTTQESDDPKPSYPDYVLWKPVTILDKVAAGVPIDDPVEIKNAANAFIKANLRPVIDHRRTAQAFSTPPSWSFTVHYTMGTNGKFSGITVADNTDVADTQNRLTQQDIGFIISKFIAAQTPIKATSTISDSYEFNF